MSFKKIIALLTAMALLLCFAACGNTNTESASSVSGTSSVESTVTSVEDETSSMTEVVTSSQVSSAESSSEASSATSSTVEKPAYTVINYPNIGPVVEKTDYKTEWSAYDGTTDHLFKATEDFFNYSGRWETVNTTEKKAHWLKPYFEFQIKDATEFLVMTTGDNYSVTIDGNSVSQKQYVAGSGKLFAVPTTGTHLVRVMSTSQKDPFTFKGVQTKGNVCRAEDRELYCMFIGDSLTESAYSYAFEIPNRLYDKVDCVRIAQSGCALVDGRGYYPIPDGLPARREGISKAFLNYQNPLEVTKRTDYAFAGEKVPDIITVSLGTNDNVAAKKTDQEFIDTHVAFVKFLNKLYPKAKIYILQPVANNGYRHDNIKKAALACKEAVPSCEYIATTTWGCEISSDGIHLTQGGYEKYAKKLMLEIGLD